jgi:hypothetical protein
VSVCPPFLQVLTNLEELWDESQYEEAFNVDSFVSSLK